MIAASEGLCLSEQAEYDEAVAGPQQFVGNDNRTKRMTQALFGLVNAQAILVTHGFVPETLAFAVVPALAANRARIITAAQLPDDVCNETEKRVRSIDDIIREVALAQGGLTFYIEKASESKLERRRASARQSTQHVHIAVMSLGNLLGVDVTRTHREWLQRVRRKPSTTLGNPSVS